MDGSEERLCERVARSPSYPFAPASEAANDPAIGCRYDDEAGCTGRPLTAEDPEVFARIKRAWLLLWTTLGTPLLYYGDEVAMRWR